MRPVTMFAVLCAIALFIGPAAAPAADFRGVTASEIRIGQTMPYSGPVSAFGALGKGEVGYFKMVNERGGINGRKVNLISLDDSYAPPKTVEQARRLEATLRKIDFGNKRLVEEGPHTSAVPPAGKPRPRPDAGLEPQPQA
jgi:hypothetical protein